MRTLGAIITGESELRILGSRDARMCLILDPPSQDAWSEGKLASKDALTLLSNVLSLAGFGLDDFCLVACAPPVPVECAGSERRTVDFINRYNDQFHDILSGISSRAFVVFGKHAARQAIGRPVKITRIRGRLWDGGNIEGRPLFVTVSPGYVRRFPEQLPSFKSDIMALKAFADNNFDECVVAQKRDYRWCFDLSFMLRERPSMLSVDIETQGKKWCDPSSKVLTVQVCSELGKVFVCPVERGYHPDASHDRVGKLRGQLKELLEDKKISKVGHSFKFDEQMLRHKLGINVSGWTDDTILMCFAVDENLWSKSLDDAIRRYVPVMSGYNDWFKYDKDNMLGVPLDDMLRYAGGDADAVFRLGRILLSELARDEKQYRCYRRIMMPAMKVFSRCVEDAGNWIDLKSLGDFEEYLVAHQDNEYKRLIDRVPVPVRRRHVDRGMEFSRADFVRDILFSKDGFGLKPVVFTSTTQDLPEHQRIPSTSAKSHLPYFDDVPFVRDLIKFQKNAHLLNNFVRGFADKYVYGERVHGSYMLHRTVTGRSACVRCDTLVETNRGPIRIDELEPGSKVWTHKGRWREVVCVYEKPAASMYEVRLDTGKRFVCTDDHRMLCADGLWRGLGEMYACPALLHCAFGEVRISRKAFCGRYKVYDIEVREDHSYLALGDFHHNSENPNLQNFPKRGELAKRYRKILAAPKGWKIVNVDLSQAELRLVAWASKDPVMMDVYRKGGDIHTVTACAVSGISREEFGKLPAEEKSLLRFKAKAVNFGFIYGMGARKFRAYARTDYGIDFTDREAAGVRRTFFDTYKGLSAWHRNTRDFAEKNAYVRSLHGALRRLPSIKSNDSSIRAAAARMAINAPISRFASDLGLIGLVRVAYSAPTNIVKPTGFIHDALTFEVKQGHEDSIASAIKWIMENPPLLEWFGLALPLPIVADVEIGNNLGEMQERSDIVGVKPCWFREYKDEDASHVRTKRLASYASDIPNSC